MEARDDDVGVTGAVAPAMFMANSRVKICFNQIALFQNR